MAEILDGTAKSEKVQVARNDRLSMPVASALIHVVAATVQEVNTSYVTPCDGYVSIWTYANYSNSQISISIPPTPPEIRIGIANSECDFSAYLPIAKGRTVTIKIPQSRGQHWVGFTPAMSNQGG